MATPPQAVKARGFGVTQRQDAWWIEPLVQGGLFALFALYATWAAFQGRYYYFDPYISPFYSPQVWHWFGLADEGVDLRPLFGFFPLAGLVMWIPLAFRLTCYYYRKFYYRAYFMDPVACAVGEPMEHRYSGERSFPLVLQNFHRYALYIVLPVVAFLWIDTANAFFFPIDRANPAAGHTFGIGVGTLVLLINVVTLSFYTFGCHAFRHLVGGGVDCFSSCIIGQHKAWKAVTKLNEHHMLWAWVSMFAVWFSDVYVRLVASGMVTDFRLM